MVYQKYYVVVLLLLLCLIGSTTAKHTPVAAEPSSDLIEAPTPPAVSPGAKTEQNGLAIAFKGISIGMLIDDVHKKLGTPKEKSTGQDYYVFSDDLSGQIVYDARQAVSTVSFDFTGKSAAPTAKEILGEDVQPRTDGGIYKMVQFPKAGYWVSYSKTSGDSPMVSITMQKLP